MQDKNQSNGKPSLGQEEGLTGAQIRENEMFAKQRMDPNYLKSLMDASREREKRLSRGLDAESNYSKKRRWLASHPIDGRIPFGYEIAEPKPWKS